MSYYKVLEINFEASEKEITKAYKRLALIYHPDKNRDNVEEAEKLFKELNEAYECLKDAEKRRAYNLLHKLETKETGKLTEIIGLVMNILNRNNKVCIFTLRDEQGRDDTYIYNGYFPIEEGDSVYGVYMTQSGHRVFQSQPFVQVAVDKDSIKKCFITALRGTGFGEASADKLYMSLKESAKMCGYVDEETASVIAYMSSVSMKYVTTKDEEFVTNFRLGSGLKEYQVKRLLEWWHRKRSMRRLHLFGINNTEIRACGKSVDKIYEICMSNPFRLAPIPLDKASRILTSMNKEIDEVDLICGKISRFIYEKLMINKWPSVPHFLLNKLYPIYQAYKEDLEENYDLTFDTVNDCIYGYYNYSHEVETYLCEYLDKLIKRTTIVYRKIVEVDSAQIETNTYVMKTLTDEQKLAIQGGLEHHVSLITAGAGCGKCLSYNTPILMYDGSIKKVQRIVTGDLLMGDDSRPRTVLSTCRGKGKMYKIVPNKGRPFICNGPHVLTLKGIKPYIELRGSRSVKLEAKSKYVVNFSIRSKGKSKTFSTLTEAEAYKESLPEDVYDIPLEDYMNVKEDVKRYSYLFHKGVTFPSREVPIDPWMIGYWLGDGNSADSVITTADSEVIDYFTTNLPQYNLKLTTHQQLYSYGISINDTSEGFKGKNHFLNVLRSLNMLDNKHIPDLYKINSEEVRLAVLAGLIDSDGHNHMNCLEISQKSDQLADDIEYIAYSLGFMVTRSYEKKGCMYKGEMRSGMYHRIMITGEGLEKIPVILERKKCHVRQQVKRAECQRFKIEEFDEDDYYGFELDGNGRFLLGDFKVTHNTSCVRELVNNLELRQIPYCIASFTGKAVSRVNEILKKKGIAATLDRLIAKPPAIKFKYLIIDEVSMVTTELFYRFVKNFTHTYRIIFIGDENQLAPISWGNLLYAIKKCHRIPIFRLTKNQRILLGNGNDSVILGNANRLIDEDRLRKIKRKEHVDPVIFTEGDGFIQMDESIEYVKDLIRQHKEMGVDKHDLVILSPYNEHLKELNEYVQSVYFFEGKEKKEDVEHYINMVDGEKTLYCVGDRVMMLHNNYDINVMNGTEGVITRIEYPGSKPGGVYVNFNYFINRDLKEEDVFFSFNCVVDDNAYKNPIQKKGGKMGEAVENEEIDINELNVSHIAHSFAISINKSQGSEYPFVIIYIGKKKSSDFVSNFLNLNRLYTAITRTVKCCFLIGDAATIAAATCKVETCKYDNLGERLFLMKDEGESIMNALTCYETEEVIPFFGGDASEFDEFDDDD
jgi:hypothetical protein